MKLLIKQRVFSWTDTYDVYDEAGNPKYYVKAEFFTLGHRIHVYDMNQNTQGGSATLKLSQTVVDAMTDTQKTQLAAKGWTLTN